MPGFGALPTARQHYGRIPGVHLRWPCCCSVHAPGVVDPVARIVAVVQPAGQRRLIQVAHPPQLREAEPADELFDLFAEDDSEAFVQGAVAAGLGDQFRVVGDAHDDKQPPVLGGDRHRAQQLVVGVVQPLGGGRVAACFGVTRVGIRIGRYHPADPLQSAHPPAGIGGRLQQELPRADQRLLVLRVQAAEVLLPLDLDRGGEHCLVGLQQDRQVPVRGAGPDPLHVRDSWRWRYLLRGAVPAPAHFRCDRPVEQAPVAQQPAVRTADLEPFQEGPALPGRECSPAADPRRHCEAQQFERDPGSNPQQQQPAHHPCGEHPLLVHLETSAQQAARPGAGEEESPGHRHS